MKKTTNKNITCKEPIKVIQLLDLKYKEAVRKLKTEVNYEKYKYLENWVNQDVMLKNIDNNDVFSFKLLYITFDSNLNNLKLEFEHI